VQPPQPLPQREPRALYDAVGGEPTFRALIGRFFQRVPEDEVLRAVYPQDDLEGAEERLRLFLMQYWGGPQTYMEQRGHPRLRMRHAPFVVGEAERVAWLREMRAALDETEIPEPYRGHMWDHFESTAAHMVNARSESTI
jgi:hemoglobin